MTEMPNTVYGYIDVGGGRRFAAKVGEWGSRRGLTQYTHTETLIKELEAEKYSEDELNEALDDRALFGSMMSHNNATDAAIKIVTLIEEEKTNDK